MMSMGDSNSTFRKQIGDLKLTSYFGSPRILDIELGDNASLRLTVEECRDLRYALDRFLERHGGGA